MVPSRINEARFDRVIVWIYYCLGINDGMSASVEFLKTLNPEPLKDAEWRTTLRSFLPPELAALRQPQSNLEPAVRLIEQELTEIRTVLRSRTKSGSATKETCPKTDVGELISKKVSGNRTRKHRRQGHAAKSSKTTEPDIKSAQPQLYPSLTRISGVTEA